MTLAAIALQEKLFTQLSGDTHLTGLLNGANIFDDVPPKKKPPYLVFGKSSHSDWSTGTEAGLEHFISLRIWSRQRGRKQVVELADATLQALDNLGGDLGDHALINFMHEFTEIGKDDDTGLFLAELNFRGVTEPL